MKSKVTTFLLIVAVDGIWGVVLKKIFFPVKPSGEFSRMERHVEQGKAEERDSLLLNYRDPFLGTAKGALRREQPAAPAAFAGIRQPLPSKAAQPPPPEKLTFRYAGTIGQRGKLYCMIEEKGKHYMLKEGEELNGYVLKKIFSDSLLFLKAGTRYTVKRTE